MTDQHKHAIAMGQRYIKGNMFEKVDENKCYCFYKQSKNFENILIRSNEIGAVNVEFDGEKMTEEEYVSICNDIL